jgi:hypothetical protein
MEGGQHQEHKFPRAWAIVWRVWLTEFEGGRKWEYARE